MLGFSVLKCFRKWLCYSFPLVTLLLDFNIRKPTFPGKHFFRHIDGCKSVLLNVCFLYFQSSVPDMTVSFSSRASSMVVRQPNGFFVIPANVSWTGLQVNTQGDPVYWKLPNVTGDRVSTFCFNFILHKCWNMLSQFHKFKLTVIFKVLVPKTDTFW